MIHIPANPAAYIAANHVVGLSLDRLPSGQILACEVRQDEAGELRIPLGSLLTQIMTIAGDRVAQMLQMHPQLMRPPSPGI